MSFIASTEHILLMIDRDGGCYSDQDLEALRDAGIQTVVRYVIWRDIALSRTAVNWEPIDAWLAQDRRVGLKTMLAVYDLAPPFWPDHYYMQDHEGARFQGGFYENLLAPWCNEAWQLHLNFINEVCQRYNAEDVLCFRATMHGGEVMLPDSAPVSRPLVYQTAEALSYWFLREQAVFYETHPAHELWTSFHHAFDDLDYTGNWCSETLIDAMYRRWPLDLVHHRLCYTRFANVGGIEKHDAEARTRSVWCGSEYAEGLLQNTETAIQLGYRGFIMAPLHMLSTHRRLAPWMIEAVRDSNERWRAHAS